MATQRVLHRVEMNGMRCLKCLDGTYKDSLTTLSNEVECPACGDTKAARIPGPEFSKLVADMGRSDGLLNKLMQLRRKPLVRRDSDE